VRATGEQARAGGVDPRIARLGVCDGGAVGPRGSGGRVALGEPHVGA
jgi:hypothetical protein